MAQHADDVRDRLITLEHPEGGFGYSPGQPGHLEPTCLAILALSAQTEKHAAVLNRSRAYCAQHAAADGSYRLSRGRPQAAWPTALVLATNPGANATADRLLGIEGRVLPNDPEFADTTDINVSLMGWPW
ncbi:MAG: DUF362 domain-containing protein, partial [Gemmataceae bacterium]